MEQVLHRLPLVGSHQAALPLDDGGYFGLRQGRGNQAAGMPADAHQHRHVGPGQAA